MRDRPNAADLLDIARKTYLKELLPQVPQDKRYTALMVANAMAIARREIEYGDEPLVRELGRIARIYGEEPPAVADKSSLTRELERLSRRLAADIRSGEFDSPSPHRGAVRKHLVKTTLQRLRENNPKHLESEGYA